VAKTYKAAGTAKFANTESNNLSRWTNRSDKYAKPLTNAINERIRQKAAAPPFDTSPLLLGEFVRSSTTLFIFYCPTLSPRKTIPAVRLGLCKLTTMAAFYLVRSKLCFCHHNSQHSIILCPASVPINLEVFPLPYLPPLLKLPLGWGCCVGPHRPSACCCR